MRTTKSLKVLLAAVATVVLLAGCATTPAPVVNHSFGPGAPTSPTAPAAQPATTTPATPTPRIRCDKLGLLL
jgi:PBP1b-binding outer membrane lipoprotein LpoB